jgi:biofilm PGA synthesis protein PgaD
MPVSPRPHTIDVPHLLTGKQRARDTALTGLMWVLYAYLWLPAVSLGAWLLGIDFAYEVMVRAGGAQGLRVILAWYALALLAMIVAVVAWSAIERIRFRRSPRRHIVTPVDDEAISRAFGVETTQLRLLRQANCLQLGIDSDGRLQAINSGAAPRGAKASSGIARR